MSEELQQSLLGDEEHDASNMNDKIELDHLEAGKPGHRRQLSFDTRWKTVLVSGSGTQEANGTFEFQGILENGGHWYKLLQEDDDDEDDGIEPDVYLYRKNESTWWITEEPPNSGAGEDSYLYHANNKESHPPFMGWRENPKLAKRPPPYISCPFWDHCFVTLVGKDECSGFYKRVEEATRLVYRRDEYPHCIIRSVANDKRHVRWEITNGKEGDEEEIFYHRHVGLREHKQTGHPPIQGWKITHLHENYKDNVALQKERENEEDSGDKYTTPDTEYFPPPFLQLEPPHFEAEMCIAFGVWNDGYHLKLVGDDIDVIPEEGDLETLYEDNPLIQEHNPTKIIRNLKYARLSYVLKLSPNKEQIYCFVGVAETHAQRWTDYQDHDILIDPQNCIDIGREPDIGYLLAKRTDKTTGEVDQEDPGYDKLDLLFGQDTSLFFCPTVTPENDIPVNMHKWDNVYVQFNRSARPEIYKHWNKNSYDVCEVYEDDFDESTVFHPRLKLRILYELMTGNISQDELSLPSGAELRVEELAASARHPIIAVFPLTDQELKEQTFEIISARALWSIDQFKSETLPAIKDYFGEEIGFYFGFLNHYNMYLLGAGLVGFIVFIVQIDVGLIDIAGLPVVSLLIISWAIVLLEGWKKKEARFRTDWGMSRFIKKAVPRPAFHGFQVISNVDGKIEEVQASNIWYMVKVIFSISTVTFCLFIVMIVLYGYLWWGDNSPQTMEYSIIRGCVNAVQIVFFNQTYYYLSFWLNDVENHRLEIEYEKSIVWKQVTFYFINSFASLFYIAFVKQFDTHEECLELLRIQLGSLFVTMIFVQNAIEFFFQDIYNCIMDCCCGGETERDEIDHSEYEHRTSLVSEEAVEDADDQLRRFPSTPVRDNLAELATQFGYISFFVIVFPLNPLLACLNNAIEVYVDLGVYKKSRRAIPKGADGLGTWNSVFDYYVLFGIVTNYGLCVFRTKAVDDFTGEDHPDTKVWFFAFCIAFTLILTEIITFLIPDIPAESVEASLRTESIEKSLVMRALMPEQKSSRASLKTMLHIANRKEIH